MSSRAALERPRVAADGPAGAFLVELSVVNGAPFHDHWSYFVRSHADPNIGVKIHATGDVRNGFTFEIKRKHDYTTDTPAPTERIPLQWVDAKYFDEQAMFNGWCSKLDYKPVCGFEESAYKVEVPGKSLNSTDGGSARGRKVMHRDCQTWIVESAKQLIKDGIFQPEVAAFLEAFQQK